MIEIQFAKKDDLPQIVEIYNQAIVAGQCTADTEVFSIDDRLDWFKSHNKQRYPLLVAKEGDVVLGYLTISAYRFGREALKETAEVSYYIHFDHHRKGVASVLMDKALTLCTSLNIKTLIAILISCNHSSISLLKKYGFEEWGNMPETVNLDGDYFDHLYYGLRLLSSN